jgi:hypothetical protein
VVASLAQPILRSGQQFNLSAGWGGYSSANAVGFSATSVLARNMLRAGIGTLAQFGGVSVGAD